MQERLSKTFTVPFGAIESDGIARARVSCGPDLYGTEWRVERYVTTCVLLNPTVQIYVYVYQDVESPGNMIDCSRSAKQDTGQGEPPWTLRQGNRLLFKWESQLLDPGIGSTATINLYGTIMNPRRT